MPDQIIRKLAEDLKWWFACQQIDEMCRTTEGAEPTWNRWPVECDGLEANGAKILKELEVGNAPLMK